jgi:hypothetical protein
VIAAKAAMGAARDSEDPAMTDRFDDAEPTHAASATAHLLHEIQLHGYRPDACARDQVVFVWRTPPTKTTLGITAAKLPR